eukprot:13034392-Alexandrium_andersonii.AAC.1
MYNLRGWSSERAHNYWKAQEAQPASKAERSADMAQSDACDCLRRSNHAVLCSLTQCGQAGSSNIELHHSGFRVGSES